MNKGVIRKTDPLLIALLGGTVSALLALLPVINYPLLLIPEYFAVLPLYCIGFGWGLSYLGLAILVAFGLFALKGGISLGIVFFVTALVPILLIVYRFQKGEPAGYIVSWITGFVLSLFIGAFVIFSAASSSVLENLPSQLTLFAQGTPLKNISSKVIQLLPGILGLALLVRYLVNAYLAQWLLKKLDLSPHLFTQPAKIEVHESWDIIFVLGLLLVLTDNSMFAFIGKNMALISSLPIFLGGLRIVYTQLEHLVNPRLWTIGIIFISILLVWPGIIIVILGVLEPTLHLRQRWKKN